MKKLILTSALALGIFVANAQKIKEAAVPAVVKAKFASMFPGAKVEKWEKEGANFEAEFDQGKVETSAVFDAAGNHLETEVEITASLLPKGVTEYMATNLKGKKIEDMAKITDSKGVVTYEAEVDDVDYLFDASGKFLSKKVEKVDKEDKDDKK